MSGRGLVYVRVLGWLALVPGVVLCLLGVAAWPPGGLMFALPYFFLIPGISLVLFGALLLWAVKRTGKPPAR